jgi:ribosomal-protein-alanine N-acetyltransferase
VQVRRATIEDVPTMMEIEHSSSSAAHWPRRLYENLFADSGSSPNFYRLAWVVEDQKQPAEGLSRQVSKILAFLVARRVDSEWELENLVVAETFRRRGVGFTLLAALVAEARAQRANVIFLEVRESNFNAQALYEKAGFMRMNSRENYYSNPSEDAVTYRLSLPEEELP